MGEVGERLREAREAKGLTLEQVEEITKIRRRYLQALEDEDYDQLPGEVFTRGFLRNYARAVGLDPDEILAAGGRRAPSPLVPLEQSHEPYLDEPLAPPEERQRLIAVLIGAMVVVALGLGGWTFWRYLGLEGILPAPPQPTATETSVAAGDEATPRPTFTPPAASAPEITITPTATNTAELTAVPPTPVPETGVLLRVEATQASWVHVVVDGNLAYEATLAPGQVLEWRGNEQIFMRTGNAGGLRIWYNGQEEAPLGAVGAVKEHVWTAGNLPAGESTGTSPEVTPGPVGPPPTPVTPTATPTSSG